jgi:hypothetical protein
MLCGTVFLGGITAALQTSLEHRFVRLPCGISATCSYQHSPRVPARFGTVLRSYNFPVSALKVPTERGGRGRIRTSVARKERQIYSLLVLATHPPVRKTTEGFSNRDPSQLPLRRAAFFHIAPKRKHKKDSCQKTPARQFYIRGFAPPHSPRTFLVELAEGIEPPTL